ncbi:antibiotic biosynthesis monooxygenase family protein [Sphingomonas sp.]|uniref:antibiotic biosynthesis monooxygenase family protein n=1 Tax=Sphingomonas sp. TaxID=28214 RepID=UPI003D6D3C86
MLTDRDPQEPPPDERCGDDFRTIDRRVAIARGGIALAGLVLLSACKKELAMPTKPTIARIWPGRTRRDVADRYEPYLRAEGIPPLEKTALGVQLFREDREDETWFVTISYWADMQAMTAFTKGDPTKVHHLDRDKEFLIELPERIEILRILEDRQGLR